MSHNNCNPNEFYDRAVEAYKVSCIREGRQAQSPCKEASIVTHDGVTLKDCQAQQLASVRFEWKTYLNEGHAVIPGSEKWVKPE